MCVPDEVIGLVEEENLRKKDSRPTVGGRGRGRGGGRGGGRDGGDGREGAEDAGDAGAEAGEADLTDGRGAFKRLLRGGFFFEGEGEEAARRARQSDERRDRSSSAR